MTTEEREALILEFSRFREQNQREHGEMLARIESLRADLERALRVQLIQGVGIAAVAVSAIGLIVGLFS